MIHYVLTLVYIMEMPYLSSCSAQHSIELIIIDNYRSP
jgi:hypothetical protein